MEIYELEKIKIIVLRKPSELEKNTDSSMNSEKLYTNKFKNPTEWYKPLKITKHKL